METSDSEWREFRPSRSHFNSDVGYQSYCENLRCGLCHDELAYGDEFSMESVSHFPGYNQLAVVVHRKCVER